VKLHQPVCVEALVCPMKIAESEVENAHLDCSTIISWACHSRGRVRQQCLGHFYCVHGLTPFWSMSSLWIVKYPALLLRCVSLPL
jgi:hypothetical protein